MEFEESGSIPSFIFHGENKSEPESSGLINHLPDAVIQHMLSFLPTNYAVATSVLSKRWRYLWTTVPVLKFDNSMSNVHDPSFTEFVDRVLGFHNLASLEKFHLKCSPYSNFSDIEKWIDVAIDSCPRELKLSMFSCLRNRFTLPRSALNSKTLVVLKLKGEGVFLDVRDSLVNLPSLKILHLLFVHYRNGGSLAGLLSGCLALEEIHLRRCFYGDNVRTLRICVPTLKRLTLVSTKTDHRRKYKLQIKAPALEFLEIRAIQIQELLVDDFADLAEATVDFHESVMTKILGALRTVKFLSVDNLPCFISEQHIDFFPKYHCLVRLEFTVVSHSWVVLMNLLENSPNLEALVLLKGEDGLSWSPPQSVPPCLLHRLERFCIRGFCFSAWERELVNYIIANAQALKQVSIHTLLRDSEAKIDVLNELSTFYRCSENCQFEIV